MEKKEIKALLLLIALLAVFFIAGMLAERAIHRGRNDDLTGSEIVSDTVTVVDTVKYVAPVPTLTAQTRYKLVTIPVAVEDAAEAVDSAHAVALCQDGTTANDSVAIKLPIVQNVYKEEDYIAYVSGYEPRLDSIFVFPKHEVVTNTVKQPPKRWHIGPMAGFGYSTKGFGAFVGVGITYSLFGL